jgi:hypothetical protein
MLKAAIGRPLVLLSLVTAVASGDVLAAQGAPGTRVVVVGLGISADHCSAAAAVVAALQPLVAATNAHMVPSDTIGRMLMVSGYGCSLRAAGDLDALRKALRAERAIGITVVSTSDGYRIVATDVRWNDAAPGGRLPSATGDDMAAAARALAQRLVSDSTAQSRTRFSGR